MSEPRKKGDWLVVAALVLAVVGMPLGTYFCGYVALGKKHQVGQATLRVYDAKWKADLFRSAAWLESRLTGTTVSTESPESL